MRREVAIDMEDTGGHSGNQLFAPLRIDRLLVRTHLGIGVMFIGKGEDRYEGPTICLAFDEFQPIEMTQ